MLEFDRLFAGRDDEDRPIDQYGNILPRNLWAHDPEYDWTFAETLSPYERMKGAMAITGKEGY